MLNKYILSLQMIDGSPILQNDIVKFYKIDIELTKEEFKKICENLGWNEDSIYYEFLCIHPLSEDFITRDNEPHMSKIKDLVLTSLQYRLNKTGKEIHIPYLNKTAIRFLAPLLDGYEITYSDYLTKDKYNFVKFV